MKSIFLILFIFFHITNLFCFNGNITLKLNKYLYDNFNIGLSKDLQFVIVLDLDDCSFCINQYLDNIKELKIIKSDLTLICLYTGRLPMKIQKQLSRFNYHIDYKKAFSRSELGYLNNVVFKIDKKKVIYYKTFENNKELKDLILEWIKKGKK